MATTIISLPALVTITNTTSGAGAKKIGFVPYRENFVAYLNGGDSVVLECNTAGSVLYYFTQATTGLTVTQAAKV